MNWLIGIKHLKECGMTLDAIKTYIELCLQGDSTIETRYHIILKQKRNCKTSIGRSKTKTGLYGEKSKIIPKDYRKPYSGQH